MTDADKLGIDIVQEARQQNNTLWMGILRIAMEQDPEATKTLLRGINQNDAFITQVLTKMAE
jgi:hypothetical protein